MESYPKIIISYMQSVCKTLYFLYIRWNNLMDKCKKKTDPRQNENDSVATNEVLVRLKLVTELSP